jgi:hypothetical protein
MSLVLFVWMVALVFSIFIRRMLSSVVRSSILAISADVVNQ